jgi:aspartate racemase
MAAVSNKVIGILAGMGPRSTAPFVDEVITECQAQYGAKLDDDFPEIVILSLPTPFRVDGPIDHQRMKQVIIGGLRKLEATGVSFIAMPCNSAHIYFNELKEAIAVPVLNIIEETLAYLEPRSKATIFATRATFDAGLYQDGIQSACCEFRFDAEWQATINQTLTSIKNGDLRTARSYWRSLLKNVEEQSIDAIICACTDLNVVARANELSPQFIDSGKALAKAVVREYLKN